MADGTSSGRLEMGSAALDEAFRFAGVSSPAETSPFPRRPGLEGVVDELVEAHCYLMWLGMTLQRTGGRPTAALVDEIEVRYPGFLEFYGGLAAKGCVDGQFWPVLSAWVTNGVYRRNADRWDEVNRAYEADPRCARVREIVESGRWESMYRAGSFPRWCRAVFIRRVC